MIKTVGVIGAGTMGNGIAHVCALSGYEVVLVDISQEFLNRGLATIQKNMDRQVAKGKLTAEDKDAAWNRIKPVTDINALANAEFVVEAATENIDLKLKIFRQLDQVCSEKTILGTNTSSISITTIAAATKRPEMVVGVHFMNPVPVMKLVEVINGHLTNADVLEQVLEFSKSLGKVPVKCNDFPGFVANRILMPMINEAVYTLMEGVADKEAIDEIMKLGMAHPM